MNTDRYTDRQVQRQTCTHTGTQTDKDRETHSVYVLSDVLEGRAGPEGGKEAALVQVSVNTDRQVHR